MKNLFLSSIYLLIAVMISAHLTAQFDDLYFDDAGDTYTVLNDNDLTYEDYDNATIEENAYDSDDYDEYLAYRENDYNIDAFSYTNRLNRFRYSSFYLGYTGGFNPYSPYSYGSLYGSPWLYSNLGTGLNIYLGNSWGARGIYSRYNDPFNRFGYGFNRGLGGFNRGFGGYGRGFGGYGINSAVYCPPYNPASRVGSTNISNNRAASRVSSARTTSRVGSSGVRGTRRVSSTDNRSRTSARNASRVSSAKSSRSKARSSRSSSRTSKASTGSSRRTYKPSSRKSGRSINRSRSGSRSSSIRTSSSPSRSSSSRGSSRSSSRRGARS